MSKIIENLRKNDFNRVEKADYSCPICGSNLYIVDCVIYEVMDGNAVYYCEKYDEHRYWSNPQENGNFLHLNKDSSETDFHSEKDYKYVDGNWIVIN